MKICYGRQSIVEEDVNAVIAALESDWLTQGPRLEEFEKKIATYCGTKYAVAVCNGTAALHMAYLAAGLESGDEVITTPNTFVATSNMILAVGARPIFCDIRLDTYNIDETRIEKLINKKTKAIVPVHFAGQPCEMKTIYKIAKRHKLIVIEDACHALGAQYLKDIIGSCRFADMAIFSFHPVKSITTGEGGAIVTNNKRYYEKLKLIRSHGTQKNRQGLNRMTTFGYNYRLTDIQAALGISQLKRLDNFIKIRHNLVAQYKKELQDEKNIILPVELENLYSSWHIYVIRVKNRKDRQLLTDFLLAQGIGVNMHYPAVYRHPYYKMNGFAKTHCPSAELYEKTAITLPLHTGLNASDIKFISEKIKSYFKK